MIDLAHNDATGTTVVHDEASLDAATCLVLTSGGACAFVTADGRMRTMPRPVPADLLADVAARDECTLLRLDGDRAVSSRKIPVRTT